MRQGYAALIEEEIDLEICGSTGSTVDARQRIPEIHPDLVILDLSLEDGSGLDLIKDLTAQFPDLPILVISMHEESIYADRVVRAGARGYLMKDEASGNVKKAVHQVLGGNIYLSEALNTEILLRFAGTNSSTGSSPINQLSDRELEVFEYMGRGMTTREIAEHLMLSPKTIDSYRTRVKEKLSIDTNATLRRRAVIWVEQSGTNPDVCND